MATAEIDIIIEARNKAQAEVDRLASQLKSLNKDTSGVTTAMKSVSSASSDASTSLKSVGSAASPIGGIFSGMTGAIGGAVKGLATFGLAVQGLQTAKGLAEGVGNALGLGLANQLEQTRAQFMAFTKDAGLTEQILAAVRKEANQTPFAFSEMAKAAASLIPVAKASGEGLMDLIKTAEILAASNPLEGLEGASFALREAVSGDMQSVVERFNLSRTTLNQLKEQGVPALEAVRIAMKDMGFDAELVGNMAQTTAGRWATFLDALDTVRLKVSEPIFEELGKQLNTVSEWVGRNEAQLTAFGQNFGETLASGIQTAAAAVQASWPTIMQIASGLQTLVGGLGDAIGAFMRFSDALGGVPAVIAGVMIAIGALALATGGLPALILAAVGALALLIAKVDEYAAKKQDFESNTQWLDDASRSAQEYAQQIGKLTQEQASNQEIVLTLAERHGELALQYENAVRAGAGLSTGTLAIASEMRGLEQAAHNAFGVNLTSDVNAAGEVVSGFTGTIRQAAADIVITGSKAGTLDPVVKKLQEITSNAQDASKAIRDILNPPTGAEVQVAAQLDSITAAQKNFSAATMTSGQTSEDFANQTRDWLDAAKLAPETLQRAVGIIEQWEKGNLSAKTAQEQLTKALEPTVTQLDSVKDGLASTRDALGSLADADLETARQWNGNMEERKAKVAEFVAVAKGEFPQVSVAAKTASDDATTALATIGGTAAQGAINSNMTTIIGIISGTEGSAAAAGANLSRAFAGGISSQEAMVIAAAAGVANAAHHAMLAGLDIHSPSKKGIEAGTNYANAVSLGLRAGTPDVIEAASTLADALGGIGQFQTTTLASWARSTTALIDYTNQLREAEAGLRDLNAELRSLKLAQAMDPNNEGLAEQIKRLTFTVNVQRELVQTLKDSISAWNAETFAVDGFVQALDTLNEAGPQALKIQEQFIKALTENDFASGAGLAKSIQDMIAGATRALGDSPDLLAPIQALGDQVMAAFRAALESPSEETINAAMALLANLTGAINTATIAQTDAITAAGTLTADTFAKALSGEESKALLGSAGVSLMEALADAMNGGGVKAIEKAADLTMRMQDELQKLPEFIRGRLGTDFKTALDAFVASPTQETLDRLRPVIEQINQTIGLIPRNMESLAPSVVSEIQGIIQAFLDLGLSAEEAGRRIADVMQRAAKDAKDAADSVKSAASSASSAGGGGGGGNTSGLPGSQPLAPMTFSNLVALGHAGNADPAVLAALVQEQELLMRAAREEYERLTAADRQREALRQVTLRVGQAGGQEQANRILTELSSGLIDIDEAIRMLLQLLRDLARDGLKAKVLQSDVVAAARDGQTEYERGRWG